MESRGLILITVPVNIAIIGAGVSGLSTAFYLEKLARTAKVPVEIVIFEEALRAGGKILSERCGDFLVEYGADSIATRQIAVYELLSDLGMQPEIIAAKERRFSILKHGKMQQVSLGLLAAFPKNLEALFACDLISLKGKLRAALGGLAYFSGLDKLFAPAADESLAASFRRKWGKEMSTLLLEPLFSGLYGGDLEKISSRVFQMPSIAQSRQDLPPYIGFREGISGLITALQSSLESTSINFQDPVDKIIKAENGLIIKSASAEYSTRICIVTTPAAVAARIFSDAIPEASKLLADFRASDAAIVSLGYGSYQSNSDLIKVVGSGVIIPATESSKVRGITLSSRKWENRAAEGSLLLRVFGKEGVFESLEKADAILLAQQEVERILEIKGELIYSDLHSWKQGSALCSIGHQERVAKLKKALNVLPGVFVVGAPYGGVGIGDCIESARREVQNIWETLKVSG